MGIYNSTRSAPTALTLIDSAAARSSMSIPAYRHWRRARPRKRRSKAPVGPSQSCQIHDMHGARPSSLRSGDRLWGVRPRARRRPGQHGTVRCASRTGQQSRIQPRLHRGRRDSSLPLHVIGNRIIAPQRLPNGNPNAVYDPTRDNYLDWINRLRDPALDRALAGISRSCAFDSALFLNAPQIASPITSGTQQLARGGQFASLACSRIATSTTSSSRGSPSA